MICDKCKKNINRLTYKPEKKIYVCKECEKVNNIKRPNIFIVHQAIKKKEAPAI